MKTVLITGGNKGIGLSTTEKFIDAGYVVIVVARNFDSFKFNGHKNVTTIEFDLVNYFLYKLFAIVLRYDRNSAIVLTIFLFPHCAEPRTT